MSSLSHCLKKLGLEEHEAAILRGRVEELQGEGHEAHTAAVQAIKDHLDRLHAARDDVRRQAGYPEEVQPAVEATPAEPAAATESPQEPEPRKRTPAQEANDERLRLRAKGRKTLHPSKDSILTAIAKLGGIKPEERADIIGEDKGNHRIPFVGHLFSPNGQGIDVMAQWLHQYHYLSDAEMADVDGGVQALRDKIAEEFNGERKHYSEQRDDDSVRAEVELRNRYEPDELAKAGYNELDSHEQEAVDLALGRELSDEEIQQWIGEAEHEIQRATDTEQEARAQRDAESRGDEGAGAGSAGHESPGGDEREPLELRSESNADVLAREARTKADREASAASDADAEQKLRADRERGDFGLTGSDRGADANPNQNTLLEERKAYDEARQQATSDGYKQESLDLGLPNDRGGDLRAGPEDGKTAQPDGEPTPAAEHGPLVSFVKTGKFDSPVGRVRTPEDAAQVFSDLALQPREHFVMLLLDQNNKPVGINRLFSGAIAQTSVYPAEIMKLAYVTPGAKKLWIAHNHPSGIPEPSRADEMLTAQIAQHFKPDLGIDLAGHIIIAGERAALLGTDGIKERAFAIPSRTGSHKIPIVDRIVTRTPDDLGEASSPSESRRLTRELLGDNFGVVWLNSQNAVVGATKLSPEDARPLRGTGKFAELARLVSEFNPAAAVFRARDDSEVPLARNVAAALKGFDVRSLDIIIADSQSRGRKEVALAEHGEDIDSGRFLSRGESDGSMDTDAVESHVADIAKSWKNAPDAQVVQSVKDLPFRAPDDAKGAYHRGKVWLVADNLGDAADIQKTLFHEALGHYGLRGAFGDALDPELDRIARANQNVRAAAAKWRAANERGTMPEDAYRMRSIEEALADVAGTGKEITGVQRFIGAVQKALRAIRLDGVADWLEGKSNAEAMQLLAGARRFVQGEPSLLTRAEPAPAFMKPKPTFYSQMQTAIASKAPFAKDGSIGEPELRSWINARMKDGGVKKDEVEWSGIKDMLDMNKGQKLTRDQIEGFLNENGVKVGEKVLGMGKGVDREEALREWMEENADPDEMMEPGAAEEQERLLAGAVRGDADAIGQLEALGVPSTLLEGAYHTSDKVDGAPKFASYQLPGGENYREMLLTLPENQNAAAAARSARVKELTDRRNELRAEYADAKPGPERQRIMTLLENTGRQIDMVMRETRDRTAFRSNHFDEPNVLAHIRFNDRPDAEGKRVLFLEELQSDWAQKGRRDGFKTGASFTNFNDWLNKEHPNLAPEMRKLWDDRGTENPKLWAEWEKARDDGVFESSRPPNAPFVTKTEAWVALALKRMIRYAAENGYDRVAWTNGEQQAGRYDLSKQIDRLVWFPQEEGYLAPHKHLLEAYGLDGKKVLSEMAPPEKLADYIGKDAAEKLVNAPSVESSRGMVKSLEGDGLKVGGEGMKSFYDKIVPNVANDLLKKFGGGRVGEVPITLEGFRKYGNEYKSSNIGSTKLTQPGFDITPALRDRALEGLPLFSRKSDEPTAAGMPQRDVRTKAMDALHDLLPTSSSRTFNRAITPFNTQFHKAQQVPEFRPVYERARQYERDASVMSLDASDKAPTLLPRLEKLSDVLRRGVKQDDITGAGKAAYEATLDRKYLTRDEARAQGLTDKQWDLYRENVDATHKALDDFAASEAYRRLRPRGLDPELVEAAKANPEQARDLYMKAIEPEYDRAKQALETAQAERESTLRDLSEEEAAARAAAKGPMARVNLVEDLQRTRTERTAHQDGLVKMAEDQFDTIAQLHGEIAGIFEHIAKLKKEGYIPVKRYGQYTVWAHSENPETGEHESHYFGMEESQHAANEVARALHELHPEATIEQGVKAEKAHELMRGMDPNAIEVFAHALGAEKDDVFQQYLRHVIADRSTMKHLLHRKGTPGFDLDMRRNLATFITSMSRATSRNYHFADMLDAASHIPREKGDIIDEAAKLINYVRDPKKEAPAIRQLLFVNYLGGSVASALVNATQPITMTLPYLSQFGTGRATRAIIEAGKVAAGGHIADKALDDAMQRGIREGIVAPHETHQLYAESIRTLGGSMPARRFLKLWGSFFSLAEAFNRKNAFAAAFTMGQDLGLSHINAIQTKNGKPTFPDLYTFAKQAVDETQGVYCVDTETDIGRGPVGAILMTFKQFSISYMELLKRLPAPQRALALGILAAGSGIQGLPFAQDLEDLADTLGQSMGFKTNSKEFIRKQAEKLVGEGGADFLHRGVTAIPGMPFDLSSRLALGNLIPGTAILKKSEQDKTGDVAEVFGPAGSMVQSLGKMYHAAEAGSGRQAFYSGAPVALQNVVKGLEMLHTGEYKDAKGRNVMPATAADAVSKMVGFNPAENARGGERLGELKQDLDLRAATQAEIVDKIAQARIAGDKDAEIAARKQLAEWNDGNDMPITINAASINQRVREARLERDVRSLKHTPKAARSAAREVLQ